MADYTRLEYRLVIKYGHQCVDARYIGTEWTGWYFPVSDKKEHPGWVYIPELKVWRSNVSAF